MSGTILGKSVVDLITHYSNTSDLVEALRSRLAPTVLADDEPDLPTPQVYGRSKARRTRPLVSERLTADDVTALVESFRSGAPKLTLARQYDISLSSIKRLLRKF